jgi:hypothetical protein
MLLLPGREKIESRSQLCAAILAGINHCFVLDTVRECVEVQGELPDLDLLRINLSSARLLEGDTPLPTPGSETANRQPVAIATRMEMVGEPVRVTENACVNFQLCASGARFEAVTDENGTRWLAIADVDTGNAQVDVERKAIEGLFLRGARLAAQSYGLEIEQADITLCSSQDRSVGFEVQTVVRRNRLHAAISIAGDLSLDEKLNAEFSGLTCHGKGAIGKLASALIKRHLSDLQSNRFPLLGFNFSGLRMREMNVEVGVEGSLHVKAIFDNQVSPQQTTSPYGSSQKL